MCRKQRVATAIPASPAESGHPLSRLRSSACVVVAVEFAASTVCGARFALVAVAVGIDGGPDVVLMRVIVLLVVLVLVMSAVAAAVVAVDVAMVVVVVVTVVAVLVVVNVVGAGALVGSTHLSHSAGHLTNPKAQYAAMPSAVPICAMT